MGRHGGFSVMTELPSFLNKLVLDSNIISVPKVAEPLLMFVKFHFVHKMTMIKLLQILQCCSLCNLDKKQADQMFSPVWKCAAIPDGLRCCGGLRAGLLAYSNSPLHNNWHSNSTQPQSHCSEPTLSTVWGKNMLTCNVKQRQQGKQKTCRKAKFRLWKYSYRVLCEFNQKIQKKKKRKKKPVRDKQSKVQMKSCKIFRCYWNDSS